MFRPEIDKKELYWKVKSQQPQLITGPYLSLHDYLFLNELDISPYLSNQLVIDSQSISNSAWEEVFD